MVPARKERRRQVARLLIENDDKRGVAARFLRRKITIEKMEGKKAMTAVGRKISEDDLGWYQSAGAFDPTRVFACESARRGAA